MLSRDWRIGWYCIDVVELWGVAIMGGRESVGNGDNHCWIVISCMSTMR